jgi:hypothetical protein
MAIQGTFLADFSQFSSAVRDAEVTLKGFESNSNKVESSLSRMTSSFSGTKVIQEATLMAEVFQRAGGAAAFTDKELARMGATGAEAVSKLKALGMDVPPNIQKMADATKNVDTAQNALLGTVKSVALGFAGLFTARAALNFAKDILDDASALKDLSQQTHIGVEELQLLAGAMSEFGVDADTLGKGLFALSRRIAGGDDAVADALAQMGMSLKDVQGLQGEELFLEIERGLATLQGSLRDTTASELFGSRLGMAMAGASEGIDDAMDSARRLNTVMSKESVDAYDRYDEAIKRASRSLSAMAANMLGPVAEGFNALTAAMGQGAAKWDIFVAMTKDFAASNIFTGQSTSNLTKLLDDLNQNTESGTTKTKAATGAHREHVPALESTAGATKKAREAAEALTKAVEKEAEAYRKLNSEVMNAQGLAQMEAAAEAMARSAENAEGIWLMERDAWQQSLSAKEAAAAAQAQLDAQTQATLGEGLILIGDTAAAHTEAGSAAVGATSLAQQSYAALTSQIGMAAQQAERFTVSHKQMMALGEAQRQFNQGRATGTQEALLRGFEIVTARGGAPGGVAMNNTFNIVDTADNIVRRVTDSLTRTVLQGVKVAS